MLERILSFPSFLPGPRFISRPSRIASRTSSRSTEDPLLIKVPARAVRICSNSSLTWRTMSSLLLLRPELRSLSAISRIASSISSLSEDLSVRPKLLDIESRKCSNSFSMASSSSGVFTAPRVVSRVARPFSRSA